jgi:ribosomal protein L14E/L6E/L27E
MPLFKKFVEIGRVVRIHRGAYAGKLGVIVDVVDQTRALLNGPDMKRHIAPLKNLVLTSIVSKKVQKNSRRSEQNEYFSLFFFFFIIIIIFMFFSRHTELLSSRL